MSDTPVEPEVEEEEESEEDEPSQTTALAGVASGPYDQDAE